MARSERPGWLDEQLLPYSSHFHKLGEHWIHYLDEGPGRAPQVLMLHGNPTWSFMYRDVIHALAPRFRCVAPDYPGFGLSQAGAGFGFSPIDHARVMEQFVTELDLRDLTLLVHDWGGPIGLWLAARHPERFQRLVITNTWAWPVNGDPHFERFSRWVGGPPGRLATEQFNLFARVALRLFTRNRLSKAVMRAYTAPYATASSRKPMHRFARSVTAASGFLKEVEQGLSRLSEHPALIVWGERDPAFRARERERFENTFRLSRTQLLPEAGHFVPEDAAGELSRAIWNWHG